MDIGYLLTLQGFRETAGQWLAPYMNTLSKVSVYVTMLIPILIFWNASRPVGYWYLLNLGLTDFFNNIVKLTACVYRPWIRDKQIVPWGDSISGATGYSFPSGHTCGAASVFGGIGIQQWKKRKWLSVLSFFMILLVAFSRNYLGVHTPQDVLVGIAEAFLIICFNTWLLRQLKGNEKKQDMWTAIGFAVVIVSLLYIQFKAYPMDEADGVLLVDPEAMMPDMYLSAGTMLGALAGSLLERKRIHFDASGSLPERILRCVIGVIPVILIYMVLRKTSAELIGKKTANLISMFLLGVYVVAIYPWCIMKFKKRRAS